MIERYIVLKDSKIVRVYETSQGIDGINSSLKFEKIEDHDEVRLIPDYFRSARPGMDIREWDERLALRPLADRVSDGLVVVPENYKVEGESIVPMTVEDKVAAGTMEIPKTMKAVGKEIVKMTDAEIVSNGIMTQKELDDAKQVAEDEKLISQQMMADMRAAAIAKLGNKVKVVTK